MRHLLNRTLIIGSVMLLIALFLLFYGSNMDSGSTDSISVPSTQTDNPVIAVPLYLLKVLFAFAGPLVAMLLGAFLGIAGAVMVVVGFIRGLVRWMRET